MGQIDVISLYTLPCNSTLYECRDMDSEDQERAIVAKLKKKNHITYTNLHKQGQTGRMVRHISRPPRRDSDVKSEGEHGEPQSLHEKKCYYELLTGKERKYHLGAVCGWLCV